MNVRLLRGRAAMACILWIASSIVSAPAEAAPKPKAKPAAGSVRPAAKKAAPAPARPALRKTVPAMATAAAAAPAGTAAPADSARRAVIGPAPADPEATAAPSGIPTLLAPAPVPAPAPAEAAVTSAPDTSVSGTYADFLGVDPASMAPEPTKPAGHPSPDGYASAAPSDDRVGFAGFFQGRLHAHAFGTHPGWLAPDAAGNRLGARLGLQVAGVANAHVTGRASLTFADDLAGRFLNDRAGRSPRRVVIPGVGEGPDTAVSDVLHHPDGRGDGGAGVFEDLLAEVEVKSGPADAVVRAGTTLWLSGSPLTLWNRDPRPKRAWYYEDFEPEMSSARYHAWKAHARGSDLGRHAWPRRPLAGLALETRRMPHGLSLQAVLADATPLLPTETAGRGAQAEGPAGLLDGSGLGSRGALGHLRAAKAFGSRSAGLNLLAARLPEDLVGQRDASAAPARGFLNQFRDGSAPRYVNPQVASLEASGAWSPALEFHGELAFSLDDTVRYVPVPGTAATFDGRSARQHLRGPPQAAAYLRLVTRSPSPLDAELYVAAPGFRSPLSAAASGLPAHRDELHLGAGAYRHQPNLAGLSLHLSPALASGFMVLGAAQHVQLEPGADILRFEHTLNGRELWDASTSATRADPARPLDQGYGPGRRRHDGRLGELSASRLPRYGEQQPGGLRGGDREISEEFAAFAYKAQADSGLAPRRRKWVSTFSLDWGIPVGGRLGLWRPALVNLFAEVGAIGLDPTAIAGAGRALLWTGSLRAEPAVSLTDDFHVLALAGAETWRSRHAWRNALANASEPGRFNNRNLYDPLSGLGMASQDAVPRVDAVRADIDYLQTAIGLGCDWDVGPRTGLHLRVKHARHRDAAVPANDWSGTFVFLELKSWI